MSRPFSRADKSILGRWWWTVDRGMLAAVLTLAVCGVMLVMAASPPVAVRIGLNQYYFIRHHLLEPRPVVDARLRRRFARRLLLRDSPFGRHPRE